MGVVTGPKTELHIAVPTTGFAKHPPTGAGGGTIQQHILRNFSVGSTFGVLRLLDAKGRIQRNVDRDTSIAFIRPGIDGNRSDGIVELIEDRHGCGRRPVAGDARSGNPVGLRGRIFWVDTVAVGYIS